MADRVEIFDVTVAAGTLETAPATTDLDFLPAIVRQVEFLVPPGPSGLVGFQLLYAGSQRIPRTVGAFILADNEVLRWPVAREPTGSQWQLRAYNTDIHAHTLQVRFLLDEIPAPAIGEVAPVPVFDEAVP